MISGMFMLAAGLLSAQESPIRFFRILATNQITITGFTDGVMTWDGQSAGAAVTVEVSENLTESNGWRRYTEVPGDESRGALKVFDRNMPDGMVLIPGGINSGTDPDYGFYSLKISTFYMDRTEVTKAKWDSVYNWAVANGYSFDNAGSGKAADHPVHTVNWYDCLKWCNARSEMEGRTPCYSLSDWSCNFSANGYRLPTNAEWEYAARGGLIGMRFSWGDTIQHTQANYYSSSSYSYDISLTRDYHPLYDIDPFPYTSPAGSFSANGYGLYDMVGNVWEWCNDTAVSFRRIRGGAWDSDADFARCGNSVWVGPEEIYDNQGFRSVCR
jgi:formylglycine-generating enzyme required for sulfatase activity